MATFFILVSASMYLYGLRLYFSRNPEVYFNGTKPAYIEWIWYSIVFSLISLFIASGT